MQGNLKTALN